MSPTSTRAVFAAAFSALLFTACDNSKSSDSGAPPPDGTTTPIADSSAIPNVSGERTTGAETLVSGVSADSIGDTEHTAVTVGSVSSTGSDNLGTEAVEGETEMKGDDPVSCSFSRQDCPVDHKCVLRFDESDLAFVAICVPVAANPKNTGERCLRDEVSGTDDCSAMSYCHGRFPGDGTGVCVDFCLIHEGGYQCANEEELCIGNSIGPWGCFRTCDPLAPVCRVQENCVHSPFGDFFCNPTSRHETAGVGALCYDTFEGCPPGRRCYQCGPGLTCVRPLDFGPSCKDDREIGCCAEYCDLRDPKCVNENHTCHPMFDVDAGAQSHVGVCRLREDFDWCEKPEEAPFGMCPPPDREPNIPWCSGLNVKACTEGQTIWTGGACGWCNCNESCEAVDDCQKPATGTARLSCDERYGCLLRCNSGTQCPKGMQCRYRGRNVGHVCVWQPDECD